LDRLDNEIGISEDLVAAGPIKLIAAGGSVAVAHFCNRDSTGGLDYILDPDVINYYNVAAMLAEVIRNVAQTARYTANWADNYVGVFAVGHVRRRLFRASITQNTLIYGGKHLHVYAAH
jgi:hypothetical protein